MDTPIRKSTKPKPPPVPCKVDGCHEIRDSRGYCRPHYYRWYRTGDPGPAETRRYGLFDGCSAPDCDREHRTGGYCDMHYRRVLRGVELDSLKFRAQPKPADPNSYAALHRRIVVARGLASTYPCECGSTARQWAYQHNDPAPLRSATGAPYSLDVYGCYAPMCQTCHNLLDRDPDEQARRAARRTA